MDRIKELSPILPWIGTAAAVGVSIYFALKLRDNQKSNRINPCVQKECPKVVHSFDVEDLDKKAVYCRCWRSQKFPYCDGAHNKHNETTGDNIGPLIIQRKNDA